MQDAVDRLEHHAKVGALPADEGAAIRTLLAYVSAPTEARTDQPADPTPCPPWCTLPARHDWTAKASRLPYREHAGPVLPWVSIVGREYADEPGQVGLSAVVEEGAVDELTASQLRELARDAARAATWMEVHA